MPDDVVTIEQATVYRGGRRRYLTLRAACRAAAKAKIRQRWRERGDDLYALEQDRYQRMIRTLSHFHYSAALRRGQP